MIAPAKPPAVASDFASMAFPLAALVAWTAPVVMLIEPFTVAASVTNAGVTEGDLYRSEASCGGVGLGGAATGSLAVAVSLEMTECDVVRQIGSPDKIELTPNNTGDRFLVMSYVRGDRPRLYRFTNGRLIGMETLLRSPPRAARITRPTPLGPR